MLEQPQTCGIEVYSVIMEEDGGSPLFKYPVSDFLLTVGGLVFFLLDVGTGRVGGGVFLSGRGLCVHGTAGVPTPRFLSPGPGFQLAVVPL